MNSTKENSERNTKGLNFLSPTNISKVLLLGLSEVDVINISEDQSPQC